jgi:hypothetical protein
MEAMSDAVALAIWFYASMSPRTMPREGRCRCEPALTASNLAQHAKGHREKATRDRDVSSVVIIVNAESGASAQKKPPVAI